VNAWCIAILNKKITVIHTYDNTTRNKHNASFLQPAKLCKFKRFLNPQIICDLYRDAWQCILGRIGLYKLLHVCEPKPQKKSEEKNFSLFTWEEHMKPAQSKSLLRNHFYVTLTVRHWCRLFTALNAACSDTVCTVKPAVDDCTRAKKLD
jgi:hypothetical protein